MKHTFEMVYLSQWDNQLYPGGSCNDTSLGMCADTLGVKVSGDYSRSPDNFSDYADKNGLDRHSPQDMATMAHHFGMGDNFTAAAKWGDIKAHLDKNLPVIIHTYLTKSGHIIVLHGYDEEGSAFYVNDPAGEYFAAGYNDYASGKDLWYSSAMLHEKAGNDGDLWAHFIEKPQA